MVQKQNNIFFEVLNGMGVITLNRPEVLNALNKGMIEELGKYLIHWRNDPNIQGVVLKSSSEKFFCAGGDLKEIYQAQQSRDSLFLNDFIDQEYGLVRLIAEYPKPYISLISGICMGGGMGISMHGQIRVVTENSTLAMPEVNIGYFPDVGASYFLNRCSGAIGLFLGLTAYRLNAADALYSGLATHYISEENRALLLKALTTVDVKGNPQEGIYAILDLFAETPPMLSKVEEERKLIEEAFQEEDLESIQVHLRISKSLWGRHLNSLLEAASPLSLKTTFELLKKTSQASFNSALHEEINLARKLILSPSFHEGIRAMVIEKDRSPNWQKD